MTPTLSRGTVVAQDVRLEQLKDLKGVQFLAEQVPGVTPDQPIFVIWKIFRSSPRKTQVRPRRSFDNNTAYPVPWQAIGG